MRLKLIAILIVILEAISFMQVRANSYYVSTDGNDSYTKIQARSKNTPWKTIDFASNQLIAGDTLFVRGGIYHEVINIWPYGSQSNPIIITAYKNDTTVELPIIDGQGTLPDTQYGRLLSLNGDYIYVSGFEVRNTFLGLWNGGVFLNGEHCKVSKMNVHHTYFEAIMIHGDYGIVEDCTVWQACLNNEGGGKGGGSGLSAGRGKGDGITNNAIIRRNIVFNVWGEGISSYEADGTLIEDNIVYDNIAQNVYISDSRNVMFRRNIVYNTPNSIVGVQQTSALADEVPTKPRSANNTLINNFFLNCDLAAFQWTIVPASGLTNALIANNTFVNSKLYTGTINSGNRIINNIFTTSGTVPSKSGLSWSNNLWQGNRPANAIGPGDIHADPLLAKTGSTEAGKLTAEYFMLKTLSPAIGKGIILPEVTADYFKFIRTSSPTIGGHEYGSIADKDAPTTPTNLNASEITSTSCILNWTASTDNVGVVSYDIYLSGVLSGSSSENTMTLKGLIPSTNYKITVKAKDAIGNVSEICPEINVTTEANSNLALNRPVTMSGIEKVDNDGKFAVDGEATTRWASAFSDPGWISVDLGANYHISRVVLNWEAAYGIAYKIQVSNDAVEWTDIYSTTTGIGGIVDLAGLNGVGRYVRMFGTVRTIIDGASYGYSLYELEAYGELATLFTPVETPKMSIYPNPAYNYLTVELSSQKNNEVIQIYNASGKIVLEQNVSAPIQQISIARLLPGFYFARINDDPKGAQQFIKLQ